MKRTILVIDDNPDLLDIVDAILTGAGYVVAKALSGEDGLVVARNLHPSLILLDLNMPKLDGRQALEEIKNEERLRKIPTIVFTTSNAREEIRRAYASGASSFIIKPFSFNSLVDMMKIIKHYWLETVELP